MRQRRGLAFLAAPGIVLLATAAALPGQTRSETEPATHPAPPPAPHADGGQAAAWVSSLADADPGRRVEAYGALRAMGQAARPALRLALRSRVPEIRARAAALLKDLPWTIPSDPSPVRQVLEGYGQLDVPQRRAAVERLGALETPEAWRALGRILTDDESDAVRWQIAGIVRRRHPDRAPPLLLPGGAGARGASAAVLAIEGRAALRRDLSAGALLLRRALDEDAGRPVADRAEPLAVLDDYVRACRAGGKFEEAAGQVRRQFALAATPAQRLGLARDLFALHADAGPLRGFDADLAAHPLDLASAESLYTLARLQARLGRPRVAEALDRGAFLLGFWSPRRRFEVAEFLRRRRWTDEAERELRATLRVCGGGAEDFVYRCNAHFRLADLEASRRHYFQRAEHFRQVLDLLDQKPRASIFLTPDSLKVAKDDRDNLRAMMEWCYLRAAIASCAAAAQQKHALALAALRPASDFMTLDAYPVLRRSNKPEAAAALFDLAYDDVKRKLGGRDDPAALNRLAWLCARCGQHLDEAVALSRRAVSLEPGNAALIDTEAEALFASGHVNEAIERERRAAELAPNVQVFKDQLRRFRGDASAPEPAEDGI